MAAFLSDQKLQYTDESQLDTSFASMSLTRIEKHLEKHPRSLFLR